MDEKYKQASRQLRKNQTKAEERLWSLLRNRQLLGCKFRRQHPFQPYILDFYCVEKKLVIELDGSQHLDNQEYDKQRTKFLQQQGLTVLRFWNDEIFKQQEALLNKVVDVLDS